MSEMSNQNSENNGVNRAGPVGKGSSPGRCSLVRQQGPGRHPTTVRTKWSKNVNKTAWNVSLEVSLLTTMIIQLEDTGNE